MSRVAVVTGANKGIGLATVKGLATHLQSGVVVYLTARNEKLGQEALANLKRELGSPHGDEIQFHQLDVTDKDSISKFKNHLQKAHGRLDILINNAGVVLPPEAICSIPLVERNEKIMAVNYYGVKNVCDALYSLLQDHSRIVNVASRLGGLREFGKQELIKKFQSGDLTEKDVDKVIEDFTKACKDGKLAENGYPTTPYAMSKLAVIAMTKIQSRHFAKDPQQDIIINACCPGMVETEATKQVLQKQGLKAGDSLKDGMKIKNIEEGTDSIIYLALLPENAAEPKGEFVGERKVLDWANLETMKEKMTAVGIGHGHGHGHFP